MILSIAVHLALCALILVSTVRTIQRMLVYRSQRQMMQTRLLLLQERYESSIRLRQLQCYRARDILDGLPLALQEELVDRFITWADERGARVELWSCSYRYTSTKRYFVFRYYSLTEMMLLSSARQE
jgi:hypothetical protein